MMLYNSDILISSVAGKSLLLKEGSIREVHAIESKRNKASVYFISMVATSPKGFPEPEHYLYDIATEMELQGFRIKFLSSNDIKNFYRTYHPDYDEKNVKIYEMAYYFIHIHKGSSFFFDEVPLIQVKEKSSKLIIILKAIIGSSKF